MQSKELNIDPRIIQALEILMRYAYMQEKISDIDSEQKSILPIGAAKRATNAQVNVTGNEDEAIQMSLHPRSQNLSSSPEP